MKISEWLSDDSIIDFYHRVTSALTWFFQRRIRGWDDRELWNLDSTFARYMLPRLKRFKETTDGYPGELTEQQWDAILEEIIWSLEYILGDQWHEDHTQWELNEARCSAGCELLGKWMRGMWD